MNRDELPEPRLAIRYALWRLALLARGADPLGLEAEKVEVAKIDPDDAVPYADAEILILGSAGAILERVLFDTGAGYLPPERLRRSLELVARAGRRNSARARIRLVAESRLFCLPDEGGILDLAVEADRGKAFASLGMPGLPADSVSWDFGYPAGRLMAECLFDLSIGRDGGESANLYYDLYRSLWPRSSAPADEYKGKPYDVELELFFHEKKKPRHVRLEHATELRWWRESLVRSQLSPTVEGTMAEISGALRRALFADGTALTLEAIYVFQEAIFLWPVPSEGRSEMLRERAIDLLFRWWTEEQRRRAQRPLLVMGSFGMGKSSLLTVFSEALSSRQDLVAPLLIPLRDLRVTEGYSFREVVHQHVNRKWAVDLEAGQLKRRYCLLCDGFDELNLYYLSRQTAAWISECFRELCRLAEHPQIDVVVSSRPVLFMDVSRRAFELVDCPLLNLLSFEAVEVDQWCANYRRAVGREFFGAADLERRGLLEIAKTPLILYMLARIYEDEENAFEEAQVFNSAEIYRRFIDWTQKGGYRGDLAKKHAVPKNYRAILQEIACCFYRSGDGFVEEGKILAHLAGTFGTLEDDIPIDRNILVAHMFQPVEKDVRKEGRFIEFTHQSFREYLFAEWIWARLEPARKGEKLAAETWNEMKIQAVPPQEIAYLADMIAVAPRSEVLALYGELAETENVHAYWSKWLDYAFKELRDDPRADRVDVLRNLTQLTATRTLCLATLGFLLRTKCYDRLRRSAAADEHLPAAPAAKYLGSLLHLMKSFPDLGKGGDNRRVLLKNLSGLVLQGGMLDAQLLENANFSGGSFCKVNFSDSRWLAAEANDADFTEAELRRCLLTFQTVAGVCFHKTEFCDSILTHTKDSALAGADFTAADFYRVRFLDVTFQDCRLVGNRWDGAARFHSNEDRPSRVVRCELDAKAEAFFRSQGFAVEDCWLTAAPDEIAEET